MKTFLTVFCGGILVCVCLLWPPGAASAAAGGPLTAAAGPPAGVVSLATPTDPASAPGPVDPGTGETAEAKETRVNYAPYVIGATVAIAVAAAVLVWRRRGGPSSKSVRRAGGSHQRRGNSGDRGPGR